MNLVKAPSLIQDPYYFRIESDFIDDVISSIWVSTLTDSGTASVGDVTGGILAVVPSDGSVADNDEGYVASANAVFLLAAGKPIYGESLIKYAEANTNAANIAFGFASGVAANLLVDDGGGMRTSGSVIAIYKVDGETVWRCVSRSSTTVTVTQSTTTAGGSSYQTLSIEVVDRDPVYCTVVFKVDGQYLRDVNNQVIRHSLPFASASQMQLFVGVKNGSTSLETLNVDYIGAAQTR